MTGKPVYRYFSGRVNRQDVPGGNWTSLSGDEANELLGALPRPAQGPVPFAQAYPAPWRIQGTEVVDAHGCNVQGFNDDPDEMEFWRGVVDAVNSAQQRQRPEIEGWLVVGTELRRLIAEERVARDLAATFGGAVFPLVRQQKDVSEPTLEDAHLDGAANEIHTLRAFEQSWANTAKALASMRNDLGEMRVRAETAEAALAISQKAEAVPVGWKLVPVEPTEAMCRAGESSKGASSTETWVDGSYTPENVEVIWKDMLAASPGFAARQG